MIVREILTDPDLLDCFDLFNDAKDTINWLRWMATKHNNETATDLANKLEQKYKDFCQAFWDNRK